MGAKHGVLTYNFFPEISLPITRRRRYTKNEDPISSKIISLRNKAWRSVNPDRKKEFNRKFRDRNPYYDLELKARKSGSTTYTIEDKDNHISNNEARCRRIVETNFIQYNFQYNLRPDWLPNPVGPRNLELDLYCKDLKLALEAQGIQHLQFVEYFHVDYDGFYKQLCKDLAKKNICQHHDIRLIEIFEDDTDEDVIMYIQQHIQDTY